VLAFWPFAGWPGPIVRFYQFPRVLPETAWLPWVGVAVALGSLVLAVWARRHLGRNWSGAVTVKLDHELVRTGPYRRIRHPIYTGAIGMYVGVALASGRLQGLLALALVAAAYVRKVRMEEQNMRREFGAAYDEYVRESWAVIPWVL
jgi:protein-S-isoprenylcysteine O-methyltransferase Ste14